VRVELFTKDVEWEDLIQATKYMMWMSARNMDLPFDEALQELVEGAKGFSCVLKVLPEGKNE